MAQPTRGTSTSAKPALRHLRAKAPIAAPSGTDERMHIVNVPLGAETAAKLSLGPRSVKELRRSIGPAASSTAWAGMGWIARLNDIIDLLRHAHQPCLSLTTTALCRWGSVWPPVGGIVKSRTVLRDLRLCCKVELCPAVRMLEAIFSYCVCIGCSSGSAWFHQKTQEWRVLRLNERSFIDADSWPPRSNSAQRTALDAVIGHLFDQLLAEDLAGIDLNVSKLKRVQPKHIDRLMIADASAGLKGSLGHSALLLAPGCMDGIAVVTESETGGPSLRIRSPDPISQLISPMDDHFERVLTVAVDVEKCSNMRWPTSSYERLAPLHPLIWSRMNATSSTA